MDALLYKEVLLQGKSTSTVVQGGVRTVITLVKDTHFIVAGCAPGGLSDARIDPELPISLLRNNSVNLMQYINIVLSKKSNSITCLFPSLGTI